jgi:hypothetical protein
VIESVREIDAPGEQAAESIRSYEVTIRLQDGSRRVFNEATPLVAIRHAGHDH